MATCKRCRKSALTWRMTEHGWRLFVTKTGEKHTCVMPFDQYGADADKARVILS